MISSQLFKGLLSHKAVAKATLCKCIVDITDIDNNSSSSTRLETLKAQSE